MARFVGDRHLADALDHCAFCSQSRSCGTRAYDGEPRAHNKIHRQCISCVATTGWGPCSPVWSPGLPTTTAPPGSIARTSWLDKLGTRGGWAVLRLGWQDRIVDNGLRLMYYIYVWCSLFSCASPRGGSLLTPRHRGRSSVCRFPHGCCRKGLIGVARSWCNFDGLRGD